METPYRAWIKCGDTFIPNLKLPPEFQEIKEERVKSEFGLVTWYLLIEGPFHGFNLSGETKLSKDGHEHPVVEMIFHQTTTLWGMFRQGNITTQIYKIREENPNDRWMKS